MRSWRLPLWRRSPPAARIGRRGERIAARWLKRRGYRIRARRWRTPVCEIDLLIERGRHLWLVEVKSTTRTQGASPVFRLQAAQRERLRRAARWTAAQRGARGRPVGVLVLGVRLRRPRPRVAIQTIVYDAANRR